MKCSDVERILPEVIDGSVGDAEFQAHLKSCPGCSELVSELKLIASEARGLAESQDPPDRVWVRISNQLRAEGIIREQVPVPARPVLVPAPARRWNAWWLAPIAAAVLAAGGYQLSHQHGAAQIAKQQVAQQSAAQPQPAPSTGNQPAVQSQTPVATAANQQVETAQSSAPSPAHPKAEGAPSKLRLGGDLAKATPPAGSIGSEGRRAANPAIEARASAPSNAEDERFLSEVSSRAPSMRATYENQLRAVNAEIRETQAYIRRYPGDLDAKQHLMDVYQQKALLYQMALDRIQ